MTNDENQTPESFEYVELDDGTMFLVDRDQYRAEVASLFGKLITLGPDQKDAAAHELGMLRVNSGSARYCQLVAMEVARLFSAYVLMDAPTFNIKASLNAFERFTFVYRTIAPPVSQEP
ncbi:hypothetical protein SAMN06295879_1021 [Agreia bicolorata]|uniref:Uncharacterized protein n=1 Tax=Agreia bicolorata TaxID=110935 RepID=A0A1T4XD27_9MICO|nr:hypothetical protein [Agreia bicolorata]SKA87038.1 hypothetical protein SAMN06295879_1021 [Agreia bicolorata]